MNKFIIWFIRTWCTLTGRVRVITRDDGAPYMTRYALTGWLPGDRPRRFFPNVYLHHIQMSDADPCLHNHPWPWAFSYILAGFYLEARGRSHLLRRDGDWLTLRTNTFHRIAEVSDGGAWTLFITSAGPRQPWGFLVPGQGFTPHAGRYYP